MSCCEEGGREGGREGGIYLHGVLVLVGLGGLCHVLEGFDEAAFGHVLAIYNRN